MEKINSWKWVPENCGDSFGRMNPLEFLEFMKDKSIGFIEGEEGGLERGYFPKFNVTVAYHRAILLANYE
ncbi:hypothetical protein C5167_039964 [Papaver somniferum]|uniref:Uncharacterized protein n=1 Tax=Papaver somniferum TaxID=3469 RepID=A0A4Y7IHV7_PAPSO|nr:hypothetical protein C5167_039964 [Papaver somniferum]